MDDGYIKYNCHWTKSKIEIDRLLLNEFNSIRTNLIKGGMIGKIANGPGYGNISIRSKNKEFYISATDTGHIVTLTPEHISLVTKTCINENAVWCCGMLQASSESMSHAAIYESHDWVNAVIHIHYKELWQKYFNVLPTTNTKILYGTIEMANEIKDKILSNSYTKVLVLGGHEDGLISYGMNLDEALGEIDNLFHELTQKKGK